MSGGVDSTSALLRCRKICSSVRAVFVDVRRDGVPVEVTESCRALGVRLLVIDAWAEFSRRVKVPSETMMHSGLTPNPCALCNAGVKLALPFSTLSEDEVLVTGHYAGFTDGILTRGSDPTKDQSYFLSLVSLEILGRCFFPLARALKSDVRAEVISSGLPFIRKESQDLCFSPHGDGLPGDIVTVAGDIVGSHQGLAGFTPGQRKGIGAHSEKKFVVRLDRKLNRVIIGDKSDLYSSKCILNSINWLQKPHGKPFNCLMQTRYRKPAFQATVVPDLENDSAVVEFTEPQKSVAPGQVGAMFAGTGVIGGGIISIKAGD